MGDVAIAAALMRHVAEQHPENHYVFVTQIFMVPFFDLIPNLEVYPVSFKQENQGLVGLIRLYKSLRRIYLHIDMVADLHHVLRSDVLRLLFKISGVKTRKIHKGHWAKWRLTRTKFKKMRPLKTSIQRYAEVFERLGLPVKIEAVPLTLQAKDIHKIGISPFAQHDGKIYPLSLMHEVVRLLQEDYEVYLFGGGIREKEVCEAWEAEFPRVQSMVGKQKLLQELQIMKTLDLMLTMDSSGMHLASLVGLPAISIWGATHSYAGFDGFRQNLMPKIQLDMPCRPCSIYGKKPCRFQNYPCLSQIQPEQVVAVIHQLECKNKES